MIFLNSIGLADSNEAELLAVKEAFFMFAASNWGKYHGLMIECDNLNVVNWTKNPGQTPWKLRKNMAFINSWK
ncbi:hypothetical protein REPUB_Repub11eG0048700 [Reevesia pubescens]